jgi:hypothetical protein
VVAIIGPTDTDDAKRAIEASIQTWNTHIGTQGGQFLHPMRWPRDTVPLQTSGLDGQQVTNDQIVERSDIVFAVFRSRLGTRTARAGSGTVEEIELAIKLGRPCHVYFHIDPREGDAEEQQVDRLLAFKEGLKRRQGLTGQWPVEEGFAGLVFAAIQRDLEHMRGDRRQAWSAVDGEAASQDMTSASCLRIVDSCKAPAQSAAPSGPAALWDAMGDAMDATEYSPTDAAAQVLRLANASWTTMRTREVTPHDSESCRLAFLAAMVMDDPRSGALWKERWISRATAIRWTEAIGFSIMSTALQQFSRDNPDARSFDRFHPSPTAEAILDEIEVVLALGPSGTEAPGKRSPTFQGLARQLWEKRGLFKLAARDYVAAEAAFRAALAVHPDSRRTQVKIGLSLALTTYLWGTDTKQPISDTASLANRARRLGFTDLVSQALTNVETMTQGSRAVRPYDIL